MLQEQIADWNNNLTDQIAYRIEHHASVVCVQMGRHESQPKATDQVAHSIYMLPSIHRSEITVIHHIIQKYEPIKLIQYIQQQGHNHIYVSLNLSKIKKKIAAFSALASKSIHNRMLIIRLRERIDQFSNYP